MKMCRGDGPQIRRFSLKTTLGTGSNIRTCLQQARGAPSGSFQIYRKANGRLEFASCTDLSPIKNEIKKNKQLLGMTRLTRNE